MDKWLYIEVQAYLSVNINKMGLELGHYVEEKYDHVVVHKDCIPDIYNDIKAKKEELEEKYPRSRPFIYEKREYKDSWQETFLKISAKPDSICTYKDNYVFILRATSIRKMNLETSLNI